MNDKILIVDDEPQIITSLKRLLFREFAIDCAASAQEALHSLESSGPYAVVMSDLNMPGMNGIDLLALVKKSWPDTVRILLTGDVDLDAAVRAVNQGYIYRFLMKPCPVAELSAALRAALEQYHQGIAEREVLEQTLMGALTVLTEILGVVHPAAFGRVSALRRYARHMASELKLTEVWRVEAAALLSQIGLISVPNATMEKYYVGEPLTDQEAAVFASHPRVGHGLLEPIPRLRSIAGMIKGQQKPYHDSVLHDSQEADSFVVLGAQILHAALDFDHLSTTGYEPSSALAAMRDRNGEYAPRLLETLEKLDCTEPETEIERVGSIVGRRSSVLGEVERPTATIASQVWELLNDQSEAAPLSNAAGPGDILPSLGTPLVRSPNAVMEDLLTSINEYFDGMYLGLSTWEERMLLREVYVLARDAFCDSAGRSFGSHSASAQCVAEELAVVLAQICQAADANEPPQQRLPMFVTAVNLATRLASLADEIADAATSIAALGPRSDRNDSCEL